jgi:hypothetical protein
MVVILRDFRCGDNCDAEGERPQAMRSEPVWPFRLELAGDAMRKMEKEGKLV